MIDSSPFHTRKSSFLRRLSTGLWSFIMAHRKLLSICCLGVFLFYWFQIRPVQLYRRCVLQSSVDAQNLLVSKAAITKGTPTGQAYARLTQNKMYLRNDYESFLTKCLLFNGLQVPPSYSAPSDAVPDPQPTTKK